MHKMNCQSCGAEQSGNYCTVCGEERLTPKLRSSSYLMKSFFTELTDIDGKFWFTTKNLILHPGQIDYDYSIGRRNIYIKPVTLFLMINVLFVMLSSLTDFYIKFSAQIELQAYSTIIRPHVLDYVASTGLALNEFSQQYDQLVKLLARSLIIIQVPIFAIFLALICYRKNYYFGDYITFSLNYHSWFLLLMIVIIYPDYPIRWINETELLPFKIPSIWRYLLTGAVLIYFSIAIQRMFRFSWLQTLLRVPFVLVAFFASHFLYRFSQLFITISLMDTTTG